MYFHELEVREKITSRLQLPLAILLAAFSFFGFLINNTELDSPTNGFYIFLVSSSISALLLFIASYHFIRAFWGHSYDFIPTATESENYRNQLIETYKEYDDCEVLVNDYMEEYLYKYYAECSSLNTEVNDRRSETLHWCNTFIVLSVIPILVSYALFNVYNLDKNETLKPKEFKIVTPVDVNIMSKPSTIITVKGEENE